MEIDSSYSLSGSKAKTGSGIFSCSYNLKRLNGYSLIKPLMFVDNDCEAEDLNTVKENINKLIEGYKLAGDLISASVYLKDYSKNEWIGINENEKFNPGND